MRVGDSTTVTRRFGAEDLIGYARLAGVDAAAIRAVPPPLIGGLFSYLFGVHLPGQGTNYLKQEIRFEAEASIDAELTASVTITRLRPEKHLCDLATTCHDGDGRLIAEGRALVSVRDVAKPMEGPGAAGFCFVREQGLGRPLVLLHGWAAHSGFLLGQLALAASGFRVILPDLPGHGESFRPGEEPTLAACADALHAFLEARDLTCVILGGWSMGASVAFTYLERHGAARVAGLVVLDMTARMTEAPGWTLGLRPGFDAPLSERVARLAAADWAAYAPKVIDVLGVPGTDPATPWLAYASAETLKADGRAMASLWRDLAEADFRPLLPRLDLPALVLTGAESQLYGPEVGAWMAGALPNARHERIADAGHALPLEQPEAVNAAIRTWAASLS